MGKSTIHSNFQVRRLLVDQRVAGYSSIFFRGAGSPKKINRQISKLWDLGVIPDNVIDNFLEIFCIFLWLVVIWNLLGICDCWRPHIQVDVDQAGDSPTTNCGCNVGFLSRIHPKKRGVLNPIPLKSSPQMSMEVRNELQQG